MTTEAPSSTIPSPETFSPPTSTPPLETPPPTASSPPPETPPTTPSPLPLETSSPPPATPPLETPATTPSTPLTPSYDSPPAPPPPDSTSPPAPAPPDSTSPPFASPSLVSPPPPEETPPSMGSTSNPARSSPPSSGSSPRVTGGQSPPLLPSTGNRPPSPPLPPPTGNSPPPPSDSSPISTGVIVSVVISGFAALIFLSFIFLYCKKKRRRASLVPPKDRYDAQASNRQHNAPPAADHVVKVPPHLSPAPIPSRSPKSPSSIQPSHSAPLISSSGGSSSTYSGSENQLHPSQSVPGTPLGFSQITFTYEELAMATNSFSNANLLGQGGFGYVHKGILPNRREVAVKQLKHGSGQGEREFQAEVEIISRVHHKHLVSLVGYCMTGEQRMLVYEFVPNNNLEFHLHGKGRPTIEWPIRMKIALGAAKGLAYLHEDCYPKIIHRDIKASNILLDFKFEAKVADFGLAKFSSDSNTHVSTRVMGTFGYLAPEYASSGKLSEKSDVFSFGVMLLELITGRRPVDTMNSYMDDSLVDWARPLLVRALESNNYDALVDPKLENNYNVNEMTHMISCATACVRHSAKRRPRMSQVLRALEEDSSLDLLHESLRGGPNIDSYGSLDYDSAQYREDMKKFRKAVMSQGVGSSEYSKTSENGANISGSSSKGPQTKEWETGNVK